MNKFIKYLIESVDDDAFFSDLGYDIGKEVTFLVDDKLYPENVKIIGITISLKDIKNIDHIGTILSNDNGCWLLWNLNNEYWDPFSENNSIIPNTFGEIIAICVGEGIFAKVNWSGLTKEYKWAKKDDPIYDTMHKVNVDSSGFDSTMNIINNYRKYIKDTIWEHLINESTNEYKLYLPNKVELKTIWNNVGNYKKFENTNIYKLLNLTTDYYWTSSLYADTGSNCNFTYKIYFNNGRIFCDYKFTTYHSVALLHF